MTDDIKTKAQKVMEQFLWEPKFSKRDEKLALVRAIKEVVNQLQYQSFHEIEEYLQLDAIEVIELCEELKEL